MATPNRPVSGNIGGQGVGRVLQHGGIFASTGPSPKKRVKLEEVPAATEEIAATRKLVLVSPSCINDVIFHLMSSIIFISKLIDGFMHLIF